MEGEPRDSVQGSAKKAVEAWDWPGHRAAVAAGRSGPDWWPIAFFLVLAVVAGVLALYASRYAYFPGDIYISHLVQSIRWPLFDPLMRAVSALGQRLPASLIILACAAGISLSGHRLEALFALTTFFGDGLALALKLLIARPRPTPDLVQVLTSVEDTGFPSGHALHFVILYGFLIFLAWTLVRPPVLRLAVAVLLGALICMVGLSRIYLGAHWASDVAGGYLIGGLWLSAEVKAYRYCAERRWPKPMARP